jgi:hypothetical protein
MYAATIHIWPTMTERQRVIAVYLERYSTTPPGEEPMSDAERMQALSCISTLDDLCTVVIEYEHKRALKFPDSLGVGQRIDKILEEEG